MESELETEEWPGRCLESHGQARHRRHGKLVKEDRARESTAQPVRQAARMPPTVARGSQHRETWAGAFMMRGGIHGTGRMSPQD